MYTNPVLSIFSFSLVAFVLVGGPGLRGHQLTAQERLHQLPRVVDAPSHIEAYGPQCTEAGLFHRIPDAPDPLLVSFDALAGMCTEERLARLDKLAFLRRNDADQYQQPGVDSPSSPDVALDSRLSAASLLDLRLKARSSQEFGELARPDAATSRLSASSETAHQNLSVRLQPYVTRDFTEATRPLEELGGQYQLSPLDPTDRIYGFGILSDYKVSSWLHLNSSYRFNIHSTGSRRSSSTQQGGDASHSLFFGITVPFQAPSGEE
jgi:hypothetical protein